MLPPPVPASHRSGRCDSSRPLSSRARSRVEPPGGPVGVQQQPARRRVAPRAARGGPTGSASRWSAPAAPACPAAPPDGRRPAASSPARRPAARPAPARHGRLVRRSPGCATRRPSAATNPCAAGHRAGTPRSGTPPRTGRGGRGGRARCGCPPGPGRTRPAGRAPAAGSPGPGLRLRQVGQRQGRPDSARGPAGGRRTPAPVDGDDRRHHQRDHGQPGQHASEHGSSRSPVGVGMDGAATVRRGRTPGSTPSRFRVRSAASLMCGTPSRRER